MANNKVTIITFFFLYTTKFVVKKTYFRNWEEDHELKSN